MRDEKEIFDRELAVYYDRMIRWEKRLAFESPLFEALWKRYGTKSVLDAACGSGAHLELFARQGLQIAGSDASAGMIELARRRLEKLNVPLTHATWSELPEKIDGKFDAVLCLGNSLPYVTDPDDLRKSLRGLWSTAAPGKFLMIQYKNFEMLRGRGERFLPLSSHVDSSGYETVAIRQYDWLEQAVDFMVIILERAAGADWKMRTWTTRLATWDPALVMQELKKVGAKTRLCGSIGLEDFEPEKSDDVVIVAEK